MTTGEELERFSRVLLEVAGWLEAGGRPMWTADELAPGALLERYDLREMRLGVLDGEPAAAMVVQESDGVFWPGAPEGESLFVHKLAVARRLKGRGAAAAMLDWARARALEQGKAYLRLDCAADRPKLRRFYEEYGFRGVGRRMVGPCDTAFYELPLR
ncbi:GNAT family N-acetyltransferase [Rubrobacter marinus]|uniref:GNAT family N-acetyltransferase n=1 Tax=Rubrobacter marinus TaxID=2653852 RepID=UPI00140C2010|nr:GNAT family N-acetyltransferase [Rubrobacter marinus]